MWVGLIQYIEGLNRTKRLGKRESALIVSWDISLLLPLKSDSDWNYSISFPGPPVCQMQILGLLSLHNCIRHSL